MSSYKEDIKEAKERWNAWWDHELIDRPCLSYWAPRPMQKLSFEEVNDFLIFGVWLKIGTLLINV